MNGELVEYGIHTEASDVRAHVSVVNKTIYVFQTPYGVEAIRRYGPEIRAASQDDVDGVTAEGWIVRIEWIEDLRRLKFYSWDGWSEFDLTRTTTEKGQLAVRCVLAIMRCGRFPFWVHATEDERKDIQVSGADIVVSCGARVQVKCDYRGGDKPLGTGNLFLQKSERNPLRRH